jgi:hypothetical protein
MSHFASSIPPEKIRNTQRFMLGMALCVALSKKCIFVADNSLLYFFDCCQVQPETQRDFVCWAWVYVKCCGMAAILEEVPTTIRKRIRLCK